MHGWLLFKWMLEIFLFFNLYYGISPLLQWATLFQIIMVIPKQCNGGMTYKLKGVAYTSAMFTMLAPSPLMILYLTIIWHCLERNCAQTLKRGICIITQPPAFGWITPVSTSDVCVCVCDFCVSMQTDWRPCFPHCCGEILQGTLWQNRRYICFIQWGVSPLEGVWRHTVEASTRHPNGRPRPFDRNDEVIIWRHCSMT